MKNEWDVTGILEVAPEILWGEATQPVKRKDRLEGHPETESPAIPHLRQRSISALDLYSHLIWLLNVKNVLNATKSYS